MGKYDLVKAVTQKLRILKTQHYFDFVSDKTSILKKKIMQPAAPVSVRITKIIMDPSHQ